MAKDAKYIQFTKMKGMICHHLHLQNHYTACTKTRARNPLQSQKKNKSNTKTKCQQCFTSMHKILKNGNFFITGPQLYNSIPATFRELENDNEGEKQKVENFKKKLDEYLRTIPDVPGASQNSLLQQK